MIRTILAIGAVMLICVASQLSAATIVNIPMDQQIGSNAIYAPYGAVVTFQPANPPTEPDGFTRVALVPNGGAGSWYYGPYVDFLLAGIGPVNISDPATVMDVDLRYFQDPLTNTNPYADAPIFLRLYTFDDAGVLLGYRDFGIIYATQSGDAPYPTWTHKTVLLSGGTTSGAFDPTRVTRLRFYGTDWSGTGDDFIDVKKLVISTPEIPEPGSLLALGIGIASFVPFLRRKR